MAKRDPGKVNLDVAIRQMVLKSLEELGPRAGKIKTLIDEVRELRRALAALEKRLDQGASRPAPVRRRSSAGDKGRPGRPPIFTACTVPGCPRPHYAKGLCSMHYQQWRRTNDWPGAPELDPAGGRRARKAGTTKKATRTTKRGPGRPPGSGRKTTKRGRR